MSECRGCGNQIRTEENPVYLFGPYSYCFECFMTLLNRSSSGGETARDYGFHGGAFIWG